MIDKYRCFDCKFFDKINNKVGLCKRYPPTVWGNPPSRDDPNFSMQVNFPMVDADEWCGEFKETSLI